jgi:hypothetical protein
MVISHCLWNKRILIKDIRVEFYRKKSSFDANLPNGSENDVNVGRINGIKFWL